MVNVKSISVGYLQTNCYIISIKEQCLIIDPGDEANNIVAAIGNLKPLAILITHDHFDHVGALREIQALYDIPIYEKHNLEEKEYEIGPFSFSVIFTPGHADTCVTFYFSKENIMFTGDFLFKESIGRTDLETSNVKDMKNSLEKIKTYEGNITIFPGHGEKSTLEHEKESNYFLK